MFHDDIKIIEQIADPISPNMGIKIKQAMILAAVDTKSIF